MAEPAQSMQYRTFEVDTSTMPTVQELVDARNPEDLGVLLQTAGLNALAEGADPIIRAETAKQRNRELSTIEQDRLAEILPEITVLDRYKLTVPPDGVLVSLAKAKTSGLFSVLIARHTSDGTETVVLGKIATAPARYFLIAQWGAQLTEIETLSKRSAPKTPKAPKRRAERMWRSDGFRLTTIGVGTLAASTATWVLLPINWWLLLGALVTVLLVSGLIAYAVCEEDGEFVVGVIAALQIITALVVGCVHLNTINTKPHTRQVAVCNAVRAGAWGDKVNTILTDHGKFTLEGGWYDGKYYPSATQDLANSLKNKLVTITYHGSSGDDDGSDGPFVTGATTVGPVQCGS